MKATLKQARNGIAALALAASLGFGATQALASPAAGDEAARACNPKGCNAQCQAQGGFEGRCNNGAWAANGDTAGCTSTWGWCNSGSLGRAVPPRACVQSITDSKWYQCNGQIWTGPVDLAASMGPAGMCSVTYAL